MSISKIPSSSEEDSATAPGSSNWSETSSTNSSSGDANEQILLSEPTISTSQERRRKGVKRMIKALMRKHGGSTRHPQVSKMIDKLETMNPTQQSPAQSPYLLGNFVARSSPDFPGRLRSKNNGGSKENCDEPTQYTLGRLSFGIFQPNNLHCTITTVRNSIEVCEDAELRRECLGPERVRSFYYPIIIDLTIHTAKGDLQAELRHEALCYEIPRNEKRLGVTFLGGMLMPAYSVRSDESLLDLWKETFANAYAIAEEERTLLGKAVRLLLKWWLKLSTPTDEDAENDQLHSVRYEMKRRPKGHLDVIYLDEDLRITRGNRGTVIVVERHTEDDNEQ